MPPLLGEQRPKHLLQTNFHQPFAGSGLGSCLLPGDFPPISGTQCSGRVGCPIVPVQITQGPPHPGQILLVRMDSDEGSVQIKKDRFHVFHWLLLVGPATSAPDADAAGGQPVPGQAPCKQDLFFRAKFPGCSSGVEQYLHPAPAVPHLPGPGGLPEHRHAVPQFGQGAAQGDQAAQLIDPLLVSGVFILSQGMQRRQSGSWPPGRATSVP